MSLKEGENSVRTCGFWEQEADVLLCKLVLQDFNYACSYSFAGEV